MISTVSLSVLLAFPLFLFPFSLILLAVDPGREKCGLVAAENRTILARGIVPTAHAARTIREWAARYGVERIVMGDRTGAHELNRSLASELSTIPVLLIPERGTTLQARRRYFTEHPSRGWRRFLPLSLQLPPEPYDDYAAAIILERYLDAERKAL